MTSQETLSPRDNLNALREKRAENVKQQTLLEAQQEISNVGSDKIPLGCISGNTPNSYSDEFNPTIHSLATFDVLGIRNQIQERLSNASKDEAVSINLNESEEIEFRKYGQGFSYKKSLTPKAENEARDIRSKLGVFKAIAELEDQIKGNELEGSSATKFSIEENPLQF